MNILHISGVKNWGGGENHLENLYYEINNLSVSTKQYILCVDHSVFSKRLQKTNYNFITAPLKLKIDPRFIIKIIQTCRSKKIDLVHIHDPTALTLTVIADRISGKLPPFIYSKKTSFPIKDRKSTLFKYNYKKIEKYICVSKAVEKITAKSIEDVEKIITIYNGIRFSNKSINNDDKLREKFNIPEDKIIVGHIGNHIRAKNLLTYIDVVNDIINTKKQTQFHFVQIGSFTDRTSMYQSKIEELNLQEHITFTGFLDNASGCIPQFNVFLLTSQSEGLPQVINEAFYFKVPVVSTNAGGIPEIITDGVNGFLANINDYKILSDKIIKLNADRDLYESFVHKSYEQVTLNFSSITNAEKTLSVYKSVLKKTLNS